jgi:hypothetical protein
MRLFDDKTKKEKPPEQKAKPENKAEPAEMPGVISRPSVVYVRALRNPIYDTEYARPRCNPMSFMLRPMGQPNVMGNVKTDVDTNMMQCGCLCTPMFFDWYRWRTEFSPDVPFEQLLAFRFASRLNFRFGSRIWFSVPLSYVPFTAYRGIEELKQIAPVLIDPDTLLKFKEAWDKAQVVKEGEEPAGADLLKDCCGVYQTEEARKVMMLDDRPYRIRSQELFCAEVYTNWDAPLNLPQQSFAVRLYLEGFLFVPL